MTRADALRAARALMVTEWHELRGQRGCECAEGPRRCGRKLVGYINDGKFDKHVCDKHWREYNDHQRKKEEAPR